MVWIVEKKVLHHELDFGFEKVEIPIRVKLEFEVREGAFVPDSLSTSTLYNRKVLEKRYPGLDLASLESSITKRVKENILKYLGECGFLSEQGDSDCLYDGNIE